MRQAAKKPNNTRSLKLLSLPRAKRPQDLSPREEEVLRLIWSGYKNKEIGQELRLSVKTIEAHRANMMKKMRVSNTAHLLRTALSEGILKVG